MNRHQARLGNASSAATGTPSGEVCRRVVDGITVRVNSCPPDLHLPPHAHDRSGFVLLLSGAFEESYPNGDRVCFAPPSAKFRPAGELHTTWYGPRGAHSLTLDFDRAWTDRLPSAASVLLGRSAQVSGQAVGEVARQLLEEVRRDDDLSALVVECAAMTLIGELAFQERPRAIGPRRPAWLRAAGDLLRNRFAERLRLSSVAAEVGVHPVHLAAEFRRHHGLSVGEYVRRLRIERARTLLLTSAEPLAEIALALGFSSQSHFTRTFKRLTGVPPGKYRSAP
jgi:AraC family transcriptional regulator